MASKELIEYFEASLEWDDSGQKKETSFDYREFKHCKISGLRFFFIREILASSKTGI